MRWEYESPFCITVKLQASQLWVRPSRCPGSLLPELPFNGPLCLPPSITQPIKERELGGRLNSQHTEKHAYMCSLASFQSADLRYAGVLVPCYQDFKVNRQVCSILDKEECMNAALMTINATLPTHSVAPSLMLAVDCCSQQT